MAVIINDPKGKSLVLAHYKGQGAWFTRRYEAKHLATAYALSQGWKINDGNSPEYKKMARYLGV